MSKKVLFDQEKSRDFANKATGAFGPGGGMNINKSSHQPANPTSSTESKKTPTDEEIPFFHLKSIGMEGCGVFAER